MPYYPGIPATQTPGIALQTQQIGLERKAQKQRRRQQIQDLALQAAQMVLGGARMAGDFATDVQALKTRQQMQARQQAAEAEEAEKQRKWLQPFQEAEAEYHRAAGKAALQRAAPTTTELAQEAVQKSLAVPFTETVLPQMQAAGLPSQMIQSAAEQKFASPTGRTQQEDLLALIGLLNKTGDLREALGLVGEGQLGAEDLVRAAQAPELWKVVLQQLYGTPELGLEQQAGATQGLAELLRQSGISDFPPATWLEQAQPLPLPEPRRDLPVGGWSGSFGGTAVPTGPETSYDYMRTMGENRERQVMLDLLKRFLLLSQPGTNALQLPSLKMPRRKGLTDLIGGGE